DLERPELCRESARAKRRHRQRGDDAGVLGEVRLDGPLEVPPLYGRDRRLDLETPRAEAAGVEELGVDTSRGRECALEEQVGHVLLISSHTECGFALEHREVETDFGLQLLLGLQGRIAHCTRDLLGWEAADV